MPLAVNSARSFESRAQGGWWLSGWASSRVVAGVTDRHTESTQLLGALPRVLASVQAEQVHGASLAMVERRQALPRPLPGCDALLTAVPGVALLIRTADCLPIFLTDPARGVVALLHAGWRGLAASLPARAVSAFQHGYQSRAAELSVAIGPAIRACCYEVGPEFDEPFGSYVQLRNGRRTCDLVGYAIAQLRQCGVRPDRILDTQRCTACEPQQWFSLRREGPSTGRLTSVIMLRP